MYIKDNTFQRKIIYIRTVELKFKTYIIIY